MRARHGISVGALLGASLFAAPAVASAHSVEPTPRPAAPVQATDTAKVVKTPARPAARPPAERVWVVRPNDTLWALGKSLDRTWMQLAAWNHLTDPNVILPGQRLKIPPASYAPPPVTLPSPTSVYRAPQPRPTTFTWTAPAPRPQAVAVSGSFEACVVARESGGNSQIMGGAGGRYYGLYQFSYSTWVANGGAPGDWGHASAAEQHAVFARSSPSNWSSYDGC